MLRGPGALRGCQGAVLLEQGERGDAEVGSWVGGAREPAAERADSGALGCLPAVKLLRKLSSVAGTHQV